MARRECEDGRCEDCASGRGDPKKPDQQEEGGEGCGERRDAHGVAGAQRALPGFDEPGDGNEGQSRRDGFDSKKSPLPPYHGVVRISSLPGFGVELVDVQIPMGDQRAGRIPRCNRFEDGSEPWVACVERGERE